ncbi:MAG: alpha/beta fold hydrolase [Rhodanobacter sp.]
MSPTLSPDAAKYSSFVLPVLANDGARCELICVQPTSACRQWLYWVPAMGVPARHYLPFAQALAAYGIAVALHEWRGIGSSKVRAGRRSNWGYRELLRSDFPAGMAALRAHQPEASCWLGGHSLGGQLSVLYAGLHPLELAGLVLVASGAPYWREFPHGGLIRACYGLAPLLANLCGYLPGRRMGFGGNEARAVIADWARSGRTGRYAASGMKQDLEAALAQLALPVLALRLQDDWFGPQASLDWLLGKMPNADCSKGVITSSDLDGKVADHFGWMTVPRVLAVRIAAWMAGVTPPAAGDS